VPCCVRRYVSTNAEPARWSRTLSRLRRVSSSLFGVRGDRKNSGSAREPSGGRDGGDPTVSLEAMVASLYLPASVSSTHRLVLIAIANYADENDEAYPSHATVAKLANVSPERVRHIVRDLVNAGWIERVVAGAYDLRIPAQKRPNLYRLTYVPPGVRRGSYATGVPGQPPNQGLSADESAEDTRGLGVVRDPRPPLCGQCVNGWVDSERGLVPCSRCNVAEAS
jgi:hypothetical protein